MLGKKLINPGAVACTTDTTQILDGGTTQSTALYRFEDNANDTSSGTGKFNKGGVFNGTNSAIDLPTGDLGIGTNDFSVSLWFNCADITQNDQSLFWFQHYQSPIRIGAALSQSSYGGDGDIRFYCTISGTGTNANSNSDIFISNTWYHIVFVKSSTSGMAVYVNGSSTPVATNTGATGAVNNNISSNGKNTIGTYTSSTAHLLFFNGKIDQFRTFNKALSTSEIATLYNETTTTANTLQVLGDTSCISTYTFEGNANDLNTSTPKNGTASNVTYDYNGIEVNITYATGKFGKAAVFNGSNGAIDTTYDQNVGSNFTWSLWFNSDVSDSNYRLLIDKTNPSSPYPGAGIALQGGNVYGMINGTGGNLTYTGNSYNINQWYHVALTSNGSTVKLYLNSVEVGTGSVSTTNQNNHILIGDSITWTTNYDGLIDQVRIFDESLSPGEVNSLYNETTTTAALGTISNPSTVAYYKMADATDETGSYNGTATNVDFNVQGKYGFAGKFNGSSSNISINGSILNSRTAISYSAWVYYKGTGSGQSYGHIISGGATNSTASGKAFGIAVQNSNDLLYIWASNSESSFSSTALPENVWTHLAITNSGGTAKMYMNGSLIHTSNPTSLAFNSSSNNLRIGEYFYNGSHHFYGEIDQVRIFNKVLSASEITTLYNEIQCADVITTPESYFNTKIYTGNGGTNALTGLGFAPNFVWIKRRNGVTWHNLSDSIRGASKSIFSNDPYQEVDDSGGNRAKSFTSDGFTLNGNNGDVNSSGNTYVAWNWKASSLINESASFNGSNSQILLPNSLDSALGNNNFSYSFWINGPMTSTFKIWFSFCQNYFIYVGYQNSQIYISLYNDVFSTSVSISANTWTHIALVKSSTAGITIYKDGVSAYTSTTSAATGNLGTLGNGQVNVIGRYSGSGYDFDGKLDQIRFFNKVISASEVMTLYNETTATTNTLQVLGDTSCVAAYPLGTNANDLSTNYNGTASNITFNQPGHLNRNTNGTIQSTVSASPESGFSIVTYSPNNTVGMSIGHGLDKSPSLVITKRLDTSQDWGVYNNVSTGTYATNWLSLNDTDAYGSGNFMNIKSSTLELPATGAFWGNGGNQVAYCFANVDGYQRIGSYIGNGSGNGPFVYTGFEVAFLMVKRTDSAGGWRVLDNKRLGSTSKNVLEWNDSYQEQANYVYVTFHTNGFTINSTNADYNASSGNYIFMAIAANPDTTAPTKANSFNTLLYTGAGGTSHTGVGFAPDFVWIKRRDSTGSHYVFDTIRGVHNALVPDYTYAQINNSSYLTAFGSDGFTLGNNAALSGSGNSFVSWNWKALDHDRKLTAINNDGSISSIVSANTAAGFSIIKYVGNATSGASIGHGLGVKPDFVMFKNMDQGGNYNWSVYSNTSATGATGLLYLNLSDAFTTTSSRFNNTEPTTSVITLGNDGTINNSGNNHIAYCWHSVAGHSSIGTYTGDGTSSGTTINIGFEPSFLIVKNTDTASTNWFLFDSRRDPSNPRDSYLQPNTTAAEANFNSVNFNTNGFELLSNLAYLNQLNDKYLYMAFK